MDLSEQIEVVSDMSIKELTENYFKTQTPVIIKGSGCKTKLMLFKGKRKDNEVHKITGYRENVPGILSTNFRDRKRVLLISQENRKLLNSLLINMPSFFDPDKPNFEKYPEMKLIKGYDFILEAGDHFFVPNGYWHYMTSYEGSFSISYRHMSTDPENKPKETKNTETSSVIATMLSNVTFSNWFKKKKTAFKNRVRRIAEKEYDPYIKESWWI